LNAGALSINPTACIAEFLAAPAAHVIASLRFFDPKLAERALLILSPFNKFLEQLIGLIRILSSLILLA
jgi:hypothetical protein